MCMNIFSMLEFSSLCWKILLLSISGVAWKILHPRFFFSPGYPRKYCVGVCCTWEDVVFISTVYPGEYCTSPWNTGVVLITQYFPAWEYFPGYTPPVSRKKKKNSVSLVTQNIVTAHLSKPTALGSEPVTSGPQPAALRQPEVTALSDGSAADKSSCCVWAQTYSHMAGSPLHQIGNARSDQLRSADILFEVCNKTDAGSAPGPL